MSRTVKSIIILLLFAHLSTLSQNKPSAPVKKSSQGNAPAGKYNKAVVNSMVNYLKHDTCLNRRFSIAFYVVLDSDYTWHNCPITPCFTYTHIPRSLSMLNYSFSRICVSFANCNIDTIPNYNYNDWDTVTTGHIVPPNYYTDSTINVYIVGAVKTSSYVTGYAMRPPSGKNTIVISKNSMIYDTTELTHLMGHFFGLPDTFEEIGSPTATTSLEYVDRSNCYTNGDGFCDTEADVYPQNYNPLLTCYLQIGAKDGHNEYYRPPTENLMSVFTCRCIFSQEQLNFMARKMITSRRYLH